MTMPRNQDKDYTQRFGTETQSLHFFEHLIQEAMTSQKVITLGPLLAERENDDIVMHCNFMGGGGNHLVVDSFLDLRVSALGGPENSEL